MVDSPPWSDAFDMSRRFGGDEFPIACQQAQDATDNVEAVAQPIRAEVEQCAVTPGPGLPPLGISAGLAHAGAVRDDDPGMRFQRADAALHAAEGAGRNRVAVDGSTSRAMPGPWPPALT